MKKLITVKRDREYYGTTPRGDDRINEFEDLFTYKHNLQSRLKFLTIDDDGNIFYDSVFYTDLQLKAHAQKVDAAQYILDQLTELVYREAYMDTLIRIRDIKQEAEEILSGGTGVSVPQSGSKRLTQSEFASLSEKLDLRGQVLDFKINPLVPITNLSP